MNNRTKGLSVVIVAVIVLATVATVYYQMPAADGQLPAGEPPEGQIRVTGEVESDQTWTVKELSELPVTNVTVPVDCVNETYVGVPLFDFCNYTGILWDAGTINVIGSQGNQATLNIYQAYNSSAYPYFYNDNVIMLAIAKDGQWLTPQTGGPIKLVAPYFQVEYQIENVAQLDFTLWTVSLSGKVETPLTINSHNLDEFESLTVEAEFAASEKRTSNWTGLPMIELLDTAGISPEASMVTIIAVDGYSKNYTLRELSQGRMLLGYAENDTPLPHADGGPFRLFATTEKYKWAQFWVKYITEIIVS
ncbi:MAG: molybdopterin-dependent oxidoreductase [Candidatus Bathyarchaeota archaeon]|nr:molybdopterin-dependent oxidoreductase [Candidatus Bathyarchaeota archaeon]